MHNFLKKIHPNISLQHSKPLFIHFLVHSIPCLTLLQFFFFFFRGLQPYLCFQRTELVRHVQHEGVKDSFLKPFKACITDWDSWLVTELASFTKNDPNKVKKNPTALPHTLAQCFSVQMWPYTGQTNTTFEIIVLATVTGMFPSPQQTNPHRTRFSLQFQYQKYQS